MKVLLDTNIIIHRETNKIVRDDIGYLFKWLDKLKYEKVISPLSKREIKKHKNLDVKKTMRVKLESYIELPTQAPICENIKKIIENEDKIENDKIDTLLLNEVYKNRVDFFITEDKKIHHKAEILNISEKVFKIEDFLNKVTTENPDFTDYKILSIRRCYFGDLNLEDFFWDSFKRDYQDFSKWFNKKANEVAYVSQDEKGKILAFLYLKVEDSRENYEDIEPSFSRKKRLKIGTFKVINTGYKLGERFLKIIFENALKQRVKEIYITIFPKTPEHLHLIELLKDWGFEYFGKKSSSSGQEEVLIKNFNLSQISNDIKKSYPFVSRNCNKFLVAIYPKYHTDLLPDSILSNEKKKDFFNNKDYRNAIHKVYISRSRERSLKKGDLVFFYRTKQKGTNAIYTSVITTIGIVESIIDNMGSEKKFIELCRKRSVFSDKELKEHWNFYLNNRPFIVNFLYLYSLPKPYINLKKMINLGIIEDVNDAPRGFKKITDDQFDIILKESNAKTTSFILH